jgi:hypothetical protein
MIERRGYTLVRPASGRGGSGSGAARRIPALLRAWRAIDPEDATAPLIGFLWDEARLAEDRVPEVVPDGLSSDRDRTINIGESDVNPAGPTMTSPADQSAHTLPVVDDLTSLAIEWTNPAGVTDTAVYAGSGPSFPALIDLHDSGSLGVVAAYTIPSVLPAEETIFYVMIVAQTPEGTNTSVYEISFTPAVPDFAIASDEINRVAANALRGPAGGGQLVVVEGEPDEATLDEPVLVTLYQVTRMVGEATVKQWVFDSDTIEWPGVIVDETDPDVTTDYTDERYYVRRSKVANTDTDPETALVWAALTGDPAQLVTVTNLAEQEGGTHALPAGTPVMVHATRGGSNPHVIRHWINSGGTGGAIGDPLYVQFVADAVWNQTTCEWEKTIKWMEFVEYVTVDSVPYYLLKGVLTEEPT